MRIAVEPWARNRLLKPSQLMVDKLFTVPVQAVGEVVGQLEPQVAGVHPCFSRSGPGKGTSQKPASSGVPRFGGGRQCLAQAHAPP